MKVLLFNIKARSDKKCINKDLAGGMGTGTWVGASLGARIFEHVKKKNVVIPAITTAYLAAIFKKVDWQVKLIEVGQGNDFSSEDADLALLPTSIVDCNHELEIARILKHRGLCVGIYGTFASAVPDFLEKDVDFVMPGGPEAGTNSHPAGERRGSGGCRAGRRCRSRGCRRAARSGNGGSA